jgi:hypothetical protein
MVDGVRVEPPGWMWVLGFALGGCEWALVECERQNWKMRARKWFFAQDKCQEGDREIKRIDAQLKKVKEELCLRRRNTDSD